MKRPSHTASNWLFLWTVRHLRGLSRVPILPQVFDALLLGWTGLAHRQRLFAMEKLEEEILKMAGVKTRVHRFGGIEFRCDSAGELGHIHGHGLLDVSVGRAQAEILLRENRVRRHHVFPYSRWVSFQLESADDVPYAVHLLGLARQDRGASSHARHLRLDTSA